VDRDEHDESGDTPDPGSDWSIEDFDDFSPFEGLDLEGGEASQLTFGDGGPDAQPADDVDVATEDDEEAAADHETVPAGSSVSPDAPPEGEAPAPEQPSADTGDQGPTSDAVPSNEPDADSAFGFGAPLEPEASMGRAPATAAPDAGAAGPAADEVFDVEEVRDFSAFTQEHYVQATTHEYAGLAEEVARAASERPEQMAIAAGIPGLESGVVGLEDVLDESDAAADHVPTRRGSDLSVRVLTAIALVAVFFGSLFQDYLVAILIFAVMFIAAVEMYVSLTRAGHRPMTLFGLLGIGWALFGTWYWGTIAIPVSLVLSTVAILVFFGVVAHRKEPLLDTALTLMVLAWIGGLGSLAMDIAYADRFAWMISAVVVITALMDIAQYFVGRRFGKRQLAPRISPKKTVEGLAGGVVVALGVGLAFGNFGPFVLIDGLILGAVVAAVGPLGDLAVSVVKRAIGVKDMGVILPGHGGVLDRIDAMIFVIPAAWVAYSWMGLIAP